MSSDDHKATRELAKTPLLLTLICILFLKQGEFPTKRATLYDRALSTLLSEWDASKEIIRQQPYKGLDLKCKEVMLAEVAYSNFTKNNLFFQQGEIANQVEQILLEMLTDEKRINGKDVIKAIEEQHGILVNRYENIYSFSHLTSQDFLTAKHIVDNNLDIDKIVYKHLHDKRWREVFLLLAGLRKADDLLLTMERQVQTYMATPNLQKLLFWVDKFTDPTSGNVRYLGKRALAMANANAHAIAYASTNADVNVNSNAQATTDAIAYTNANAYAITNTYAVAYDNTKANTNEYAYANIYFNAYAYSNAYANANANSNADTIGVSIYKFTEYMKWSLKLEIYQGLDLQGEIDRIKQLVNLIPDKNQRLETRQSFARGLIQPWLAIFHLTPEMVHLSQQEIQCLGNCLYAN